MGALYRLVFGQMRQEDLVAALAGVDEADCRELLLDLSP
jgi:hypothetical protein